MTWEQPKFSKEKINNSGKVLIAKYASTEEKDEALGVLDNWRASHAYPLHMFQMTLKRKALDVSKEAIVSQRLKRTSAIRYKLNRVYHGKNPSIKLYKMQDIGGCRAVLPTVALARELYNEGYLKGDLKHKPISKKDYIQNPKSTDGYRSLHLVYAYRSRSLHKKKFNGLLTEIQIRSRLQHVWATAVETTGFFIRQSIKTHEGEPKWIEFFKLVSSAFAKMESCPIVEGTPADEKELYSEIKKRAQELNIIHIMKGWKTANEFFEQEIKKSQRKKVKFFLLELDIPGEKLMIKTYSEKEEQKAIADYSSLEKRHSENKDYDVVLVGADTTNDLRKAYPNYFVDIEVFLKYLEKILQKY